MDERYYAMIARREAEKALQAFISRLLSAAVDNDVAALQDELAKVKGELNLTVSRLIDARAECENMRRKVSELKANEEAIQIWTRFCALTPDDMHDGMVIGWSHKDKQRFWDREFFVRQYEESDWCDAREPAFPTAMQAIVDEERMDRGSHD